MESGPGLGACPVVGEMNARGAATLWRWPCLLPSLLRPRGMPTTQDTHPPPLTCSLPPPAAHQTTQAKHAFITKFNEIDAACYDRAKEELGRAVLTAHRSSSLDKQQQQPPPGVRGARARDHGHVVCKKVNAWPGPCLALGWVPSAACATPCPCHAHALS